MDVVFSGIVNPGGIFTFTGSIANGKFAGPIVTLTVNGIVDVTIDTQCNGSVLVGDTYGSFTVVAGLSKNGGALCCSSSARDNVPPTISNCPTNITASILSATSCSASVTWQAPIAADNCEVSSFTSNFSPGNVFPLGNTLVNYTAVDNNGNTAVCSFRVTITDAIEPVITGCPSIITVSADASCKAVVNWAVPTATDNCSIASFGTNYSPGVTFSLGTSTVTYLAIDGSGNTSSCSFNVVVVDTTKPVITACPTDVTVIANTLCKAIANWIPPAATDNCSISITSNFSPGATFPLGTTLVTYTASDASGNSSTCSFNVKVIDNTIPVITGCPTTITVAANASCKAIASWVAPIAKDNCPMTLTSDHNPGDTFPLGTTLVTYKAIDGSGNTATCSFNIIVNDVTSPIITSCPVNVSATASSACKAVVSWVAPTASDNCSVILTSNHNSGELFSLGTTIVTYTATDGSGNSSTCSFNVVVADNTSPIIVGCPLDITIAANASCKAVVSWTTPSATDNCGATSLTSSHTPGEAFVMGTTTVLYKAVDGTGNESTCSFNVIVQDKTAPIFTGCLSDINVGSDTSCKAIVNWSVPTAIDNCDVLLITSNHTPGEAFSSGITKVTYVATDNSGNKATCEFNVIVKNQSVPIINGCPQDITVETDQSGKAKVTWSEPTAADRCGNVQLKASHKPGDVFQIGTTKVVYESINSVGNSTRCEFNVTLSYKDVAFDVTKVVTPDGDRINDVWIIKNIENFSDNQVLVVDRWGNKIYQASHYDNDKVVWNGTNLNGSIVPTGTYFFSVEVLFKETRLEKKGFIEVIH